ncbi:hypothetical protein GCM10028806_33750 [Spirosoma terrae]
MLEPYKGLDDKHVLDPEAGSGAILDYLNSTRHRVPRNKLYCLESDPELQFTLQGKGYRFLGPDFLDYQGDYRFDLVVMNPPFSNGDAHLLKAWEIMRNGDIVCLLNWETINNPYTKRRQELVALIEQHGTVENIGPVFDELNVLRKTDIDIALVRLQKTESDPLLDFSHLRSKDKPVDLSFDLNSAETTLIKEDKIGAMLDLFEKTKEMFVGLLKARNQLSYYGNHLIDQNIFEIADNALKNGRSTNDVYNLFIQEYGGAAWASILRKLSVEKYLTYKVKQDFEKFRQTQGSMSLTRENIIALVQMLITNRHEIMKKAVVEVFDQCTKYYHENRMMVAGWKTNDAWKVNKRIVLPRYISSENREYRSQPQMFRINWNYSDQFRDIEKVMCYLTGRDWDKITRMEDIINTIPFGKTAETETEFFWIRCYLKGTIHLRFKDDKLWERFNRTAAEGKNWLGYDPSYKPDSKQTPSSNLVPIKPVPQEELAEQYGSVLTPEQNGQLALVLV